ncbi:ZIP zinc/iron transport family [Martensiomyces pterosporus]|nr:ZIP zinc/iron transport family [Martensiomyces pterosporus]
MAAGVENWDRNLQISAVFIILAVSSLGSFFPILCKHVRWLSISPTAITIGKFFGAGVILSTAFIHMLGGATESLKDSCLEGRMGDFDSWPGFLAMLAILAMHLMEHILTGRMLKTHGAGLPESIPEEAVDGEQLEKQPAHGHAHAAMLIDMDQRRKHLSTYILELGIALHSVIIGMTLAVTGGTEFKTLLAAISFHQFFEGLALGTRIAALKFPRHAVLLAAANALVFALTTPLGQVIGIGIRESFAPRSPSTLMTMGVLDGLSAGILMYSAIVNLLVEEFGSEEFRGYPRTLRLVYFGAMYLGCAAMSVIGKWA